MTTYGGRYRDDPRAEIHDFIPRSARRLLDVGCWRGAFGGSLKLARPGLTVWGIEQDPDSAAAASERLDRVISGSFPDAIPAGERFDAVTFIDVIEHFADPWSAVSQARSLVAEGGVVVAAIPNVRHVFSVYPLLVSGRWDYVDTGILDRTHLRFFTRATALELFESTGFTVVSVAPTNFQVDGWKMRLLLRLMGRRAEEFRAMHYVFVARPS